ncbi:MAG TPA: adenosylhomocysteinase [Bacillota bacterium]|jgi:adenosylhomocysteinase|nr:adenosylhomocysteinase [Fastidiosipila sp.]HPX93074.1 adenosylhomocysteinase [Bacillota bacterium]HQB80853.1 adenosylhomocysteinase [Bacillota bacterium]
MSEIFDIHLKDEGLRRILWAERHMPILETIRHRFEKEQPFKGIRVSLAVHLEAKTACLVRAFRRGGAEVYVTGSNPYSTQDAICAALVADGCEVNAIHGASFEKYREFWKKTLSLNPHIVIDDGADLINLLMGECSACASDLIGACEETTSGVQRLRAWEREGRLSFPVIAVNDAQCKTWFDNYYGTGQSTVGAIMRATNLMVSGMKVVIAGYGWVGRGIARMLAALGAHVIVTEIDPIAGLLAIMDGFTLVRMDEAAKLGDLFITATASIDVITPRHFEVMKDQAILCNAGHFNREIDLVSLEAMATKVETVRENITAYTLRDGRELHVIAHGALVNIAAADGHPVEIMDISFSLQALSAEYLIHHRSIPAGVHAVPEVIDRRVADIKLSTMGAALDQETEAQKEYRQKDLIV